MNRVEVITNHFHKGAWLKAQPGPHLKKKKERKRNSCQYKVKYPKWRELQLP